MGRRPERLYWLFGASLSVAAPTAARAERPPEEVDAVRDDRENHAAIAVALGAGSDEGPLALAELRVQWQGPALAVGLGARLRWREQRLVDTDWDDAADWFGIVRRLEVMHHSDTIAGSLGIGRLDPLTVGGVADGYSSAALIDNRAPGAVMRVRGETFSMDAAVDDVVAPGLILAGVEIGLGGRWSGAVYGAVDPGLASPADRMVGALGSFEVDARWRVGPMALVGGIVAASVGDYAAIARGEFDGERGRLRAGATIEVRAYDGVAATAPFGPLWLVEREHVLLEEDRGLASAVRAHLAFADIGIVEAGVRTRGARGDLVTGRLVFPWWRRAQAGGYAAIGSADAVVAGEARVAWSSHWFSGLEVGRGYRRDEAGALESVWTIAAWFGANAER